MSLSNSSAYSAFQAEKAFRLTPIIWVTSTTGTPDPASRSPEAICSLDQVLSILLYTKDSLKLHQSNLFDRLSWKCLTNSCRENLAKAGRQVVPRVQPRTEIGSTLIIWASHDRSKPLGLS